MGRQSASEYSAKLRDPRWQRRRLEVMKRDDFHCQRCFDGTQTLHVHHLYYRQNTEPWDYPDEALITICEDCHAIETDSKEERKEDERLLIEAVRVYDIQASDLATLVRTFGMCHVDPLDIAEAFYRAGQDQIYIGWGLAAALRKPAIRNKIVKLGHEVVEARIAARKAREATTS